MPKFQKGLAGANLKLIALLSMLTDHICAVFFSSSAAARIVRNTAGRVAMPIYIFLLCEGFFHTRSRKKYAVLLLITAVISEPVYDIALHPPLFNFMYQNVCFTLLACFLMMCILNQLTLKKIPVFLHPVIIAGFCLLTYFLNFTYDYSAILTCALCYYLHWYPEYVKGISSAACLGVLENTPGCLFAAIPLCLYNKQRGSIPPALKYFFYAFYPAHLLILFIIKQIFFKGLP